MTSKLNKTQQLQRLKMVRRMAAERKYALARLDLQQKIALYSAAEATFNSVKDEAYDIRMKRLNALFGAESNHGTHQALAINTYFQTDEEIEQARTAMQMALEAAHHAQECVNVEQKALARKMLQEEKASRLSSSVQSEMRMEAARQS